MVYQGALIDKHDQFSKAVVKQAKDNSMAKFAIFLQLKDFTSRVSVLSHILNDLNKELLRRLVPVELKKTVAFSAGDDDLPERYRSC